MIFLKCVLSRTSKKPSPIRIPLTGPRTKKQDYYSVSLIRTDFELPDLLMRKSGRRGVACYMWDGERFSRGQIIPWEELKGASIKIRHYLSGNEFKYDSLFSFLWGDPWMPKLSILKQRLLQKIYNSRTPIRSSRIDLLKLLVKRRVDFHGEQQNYIIRNETGDSILDLLIEVYGNRVYMHPQKDAFRAHLLVDLNSLVDTNDIRMVDHNYVATGKAVATIAAYEEENRRHLDNKKHNNRILWLTVILAIVGVLQVPYVQSLLGMGLSQ